MPDAHQKVVYEIHLDTKEAADQLRELFSGGGQGGGGGFGGAADSIGSAIRSGGALALASTSGNAGGALAGGALAVGGKHPAAQVVAAIGALISQMQELGRTLKDFSGSLFSAFTELDIFMMGYRFQLGSDVGPQLSELVRGIMGLLEAARPFITQLIQRITIVLRLVTEVATRVFLLVDLIQASITVVVAAIADAVKWVKDRIAEALGVVGGLVAERFFSGGMLDAILEMAPSMEEAIEGFMKAVERFGMSVDELIDETMGRGNEIAQALFLAFQQYGNSATSGQQVITPTIRGVPAPMGGMVRDVVPGISNVPNTGPPLERMLANRDGNGRLPRVTDAAVHLHTADTINIQAADEDRLHNELLQLRDDITGKLRSMQDARWLRLTAARHGINYGS